MDSLESRRRTGNSLMAFQFDRPLDKPMGVSERLPYHGELKFFKDNRSVAGMAGEDGRIVINPLSGLDRRDMDAVRVNEAARIRMRDFGHPTFQLTPSQKDFLDSTSYKSASHEDRAGTIAARLVSRDPSAGVPTPEQEGYIKSLTEYANKAATRSKGGLVEPALALARRYAEGGGVPEPSFSDRAWRTANGVAGVADYYLGGLPSSLAGLMPWNTMADTKAKAEAARDDWRSMYGRGALEAAENPFNPASGIILTLPMARRIPKKLHPDDMGGANRMEHVAEDLRARPPQSEPEMADRLNKAWQGHGVTLIPDTDRIRPYTTFETPGTQGLTDRDPGIKSGPLKSFYDDPALYAVNAAAKDQHVLLDIAPDRPLLGQSGGWQRPVG